MVNRIHLVLSPEEASDVNVIEKESSKVIGSEVDSVHVVKRSIDARKPSVKINLWVDVYVGEIYDENDIPDKDKFKLKDVSNAKPVVVVGFGPAGIFSALQLIEDGLKPIIIERGKPVEDRKKDIAIINSKGFVNSDSNWCFGEGGAGTYSDGKLYTRSSKRGNVTKILNTLVEHGANKDILVDSHPHIGTDKLPAIISSIRKCIIDCGGEIYFNKKLTDINVVGRKVKSIVLNGNEKLNTDKLILATGHSAKDIYKILDKLEVELEAKSFALGVRVEHPQQLIDSIQYHRPNRGNFLPPAEYRLVTQVEDRGVYSFCMCPGGIVVPASTSENELVLNGMSNSMRNSDKANSGIVVEVRPEDIKAENAFDMMNFQHEVEKNCFNNSGGNLVSPSQRMVDFVNGKNSSTLPKSTYNPGISAQPLHKLLPNVISQKLQKSFKLFDNKMKGFYTNEALLLGVESRTSSPIRISRDKTTLESVNVSGLYPCGEGAGYSGGIVSSAIDGVRVALKISETV